MLIDDESTVCHSTKDTILYICCAITFEQHTFARRQITRDRKQAYSNEIMQRLRNVF